MWHFEHRIVIEEVASGGSPVSAADITLMTANQGPAASKGLNLAICAGLCRLEWNTAAGGRVVLVRDGQATWLYSSARNEFVTGKELRDVASSVSGAMQLSVHVLPLMSFDEQHSASFGSRVRQRAFLVSTFRADGTIPFFDLWRGACIVLAEASFLDRIKKGEGDDFFLEVGTEKEGFRTLNFKATESTLRV